MLRSAAYEYMLRWRGDKSRLAIGLSHAQRVVLERLDTGSVYAQIYEPAENRYYTRDADVAVHQLAHWISEHDIQAVCFFGYSKGGYGALLWSTMLAAVLPNVRVACLSLSPQVSLWPLNTTIVQPSYKNMIKAAIGGVGRAPDDTLADSLERFGNLPDPSGLANYRARVVYPAGSNPDRLEAERIAWSNAELVPLPISNHNVLIPFIWDVSDEAAVDKAVDSLLKARTRDRDVASFLGDAQREQMIAEYAAVAPHPLLPQVLDDLMTSFVQVGSSAR